MHTHTQKRVRFNDSGDEQLHHFEIVILEDHYARRRSLDFEHHRCPMRSRRLGFFEKILFKNYLQKQRKRNAIIQKQKVANVDRQS